MISVNNLTKKYEGQDFNAVSHIDFTAKSGTITCIIGTSGCGKTTTLKMINRLVEPTSGTIKINNELSTSFSPVEWRRKIGYVIQKAALLPHLTVRENINLLPKVLKRSKKLLLNRSNDLLEMVGLSPSEFARRYPHELSGGQQQRVGIARGLAEDPPIILMDEPFGALDPITRNGLHEKLKELNARLNKTIIIVTHDIEEAFILADQIILMDKGEIIQKGTRADFESRPINNFVRNFVSKNVTSSHH